MWNIIKSQCYQMTRDLFIICVLLGVGALYVCFIFSELGRVDELNGGTAFCIVSGWFAMLVFIFIALLPSRICGGDFHDRTVNYEVLSGHKKAEIFFARLLLSEALILLLFALMIGIPVCIGMVQGGWGPNLSAGAAGMRCLMAVLVVIRMVAEVSALTFVLQNAYATMLISWVTIEVCAIFLLLLENALQESSRLNCVSSMMSLLQVFSFENTRDGFENGHDIVVYVTDMDPFVAVSIPVAAVVVFALSILIGYLSIHKRDMK